MNACCQCPLVASFSQLSEGKVKAGRISVQSFQESAYWIRGSYNGTVVQSISPTSSKEICITIYYNYWLLLRVQLPLSLSLMSSACCHISVARWINAFKGKTSDVVNFEQITDPIRPPVFFKNFFIYFNSYWFCLRSWKSHPQENEKLMSTIGQFPRTDSLLFNDRSFTCTLDLIDLVKQIQPFQKGWTLNPDVSR